MHTSPFLNLYHLIPSSTNLYWPSTSQYRHILTQYHQVPLIIHHLVSHSSAIWIISLFTTPLKSHAQYTWSSYKFPFKLQLSGSKVYPFPEPIGIHIPNPEGPSQFLLRRSRTSHVCRQHEFLYPWIHVMGVDTIPYILIFDLSGKYILSNTIFQSTFKFNKSIFIINSTFISIRHVVQPFTVRVRNRWRLLGWLTMS